MRHSRSVLAWGLALVLLVPTLVHAQKTPQIAIENREVQRLELSVGKSKVIDMPTQIKRASLANPDIADTVILSPTQIYLTGKTVGVTTLTLWGETDKVTTLFDVVVSPDLTRLKENLHRVLPEEQALLVTANHDHVTLSGTVSSAATMTKVLGVAEAYAPKKVINLLQVGGVQQVMLEVRVAEMNRELIRRLGFNFNFMGPESFGISLLNQLTSLANLTQVGPAATLIEQPVSAAINGVFGFNTGSLSWTGFVDALKEQNALKVLAKPTLLALSGQEAAFLAGGEFPIPVPQAFGVVTIQFKKFGVGLVFTPNVLSDKHISINVAPEVSELDFANALRLQGFTIPAISTRRASTVVELADGQSFAIGGLLRDNVRESVKKFPVLGDIPILGALFRSSSFQKNETELVIIVTPHLVKPLNLAGQTLPTDYYVEPNDFEFYLLGMPEKGGFGGKPGLVSPAAEVLGSRSNRAPRRIEGSIGHMVP
ncbi:MAG: type II and III secretion system protein family protein [Nitrospiraceae bacterium]